MSYGRRGERYRDPPIQIGIATTKKTGLKWRFPSPSPQNIQNVGIGVGGSGARSHFGQRWIAVHSIAAFSASTIFAKRRFRSRNACFIGLVSPPSAVKSECGRGGKGGSFTLVCNAWFPSTNRKNLKQTLSMVHHNERGPL